MYDADKWIEKKHRDNLNKLYVSFAKNEPLNLSDAERKYMMNALKWAAKRIETLQDELSYESRRAYYLRISDGETDGTDFCQVY